MEQVLLGIAGASAANAGNLLERTSHAVLEPFAEILQAVATSFTQHEEDLDVKAESQESLLANRIEKTLQAAGIETSEPVELSLRDGKLVVVGDHPQRALIEAALAQDPTLAEGMSQLLESSDSSAALGGEFSPPPMDQQPRIAAFSHFAGEPRLELLYS